MRIVAVLATIAALTGAPSIASGAGNSLASPTASPTTGTVATIFTLRVSYDGKWPATAVTVSVAGLTLPLTRADGTAESGTWSVTTVLPAGTWTPAFSAVAAQGNAATIAGPALTVMGLPALAATPAPTVTNTLPSGGDETGSEAPGGGEDPLGSIVPDPAPAPAPAPDDETSPAPRPESESTILTTPSPTASGRGPGNAPGGPGASGSSASRATTSPVPEKPDGGAGGGAPAAPSDPEPDAVPSVAPGAMPVAERAPDEEPEAGVVDDPMLGIVLLLGVSGVATLAIIGTTLLLVGRRRVEDEEVAATVAELGDTDAVLERRTVRRAKVRLADDPIVTAMGVDDQVAARRRRTKGAGQVGSGPGERTGGGR